jgi:hypothetical protein
VGLPTSKFNIFVCGRVKNACPHFFAEHLLTLIG